MNAPTMPGFTAEVSAYTTRGHYRMAGSPSLTMEGRDFQPDVLPFCGVGVDECGAPDTGFFCCSRERPRCCVNPDNFFSVYTCCPANNPRCCFDGGGPGPCPGGALLCGNHCCLSKQYCGDTFRGICCDQSTVFTKDGCCDPARLCGFNACCGGNTICTDPTIGLCCPPGWGQCGGICCPPANVCAGGICCPPGSGPLLCAGECCPAVNTCSNGICCPPGSGPGCGGICCPAGNTCFNGCCLTNAVPSPSSNTNYLLKNNCQNITGLSLGLAASQDMVTSNGWTLQLNAYNPTGPATSWMQYVISVNGNSMLAMIQYYDIATFNSCIPCPDLPCTTHCINGQTQLLNLAAAIDVKSAFGPSTLPRGWNLGIALTNDASGNVTAATFTVTDNATPAKSYPTTIQVPKNLQFPIVSFEANIVGPGSGANANFTTGAGTLSYQSNGQLCVEGGLPEACSNSPARGTGTAETSNATYGAMSSCCGATLTQTLGLG